jgi:NTP pyrophosphatase (non-canonical NTP hydrolase)
MKDIQKRVDDWIKQYDEGYWQPLEMMARLTEEVGELAREINHRYGAKKKKTSEDKKELGEEMADVIFTLACMANSLGVDLDESFESVMEKYNSRDGERFKKKT